MLLRISTDPRVKGPYEIHIRGTDNVTSWTQSRVFADADDSVQILAGDLPLGTYEVTATSDVPLSVTVAYRFRLVVTD